MENWRFINDNPDYMVSDHGRVMSLKGKSKQMLTTSISPNSYEKLLLSQKGIHTTYMVHRLVAMAFIPNPKRLSQVNHLDGNTLNNHASNLEWCDAYDNIRHALLKGLRSKAIHPIPCATTDPTGTVLHPYRSLMAMQRGEHMRSSHKNWLRLYLAHPEYVRQFAQRKHPTQVFPALSPYAPVLHSATHQYYRRLSPEEALTFGVATITALHLHTIKKEKNTNKEMCANKERSTLQ